LKTLPDLQLYQTIPDTRLFPQYLPENTEAVNNSQNSAFLTRNCDSKLTRFLGQCDQVVELEICNNKNITKLEKISITKLPACQNKYLQNYQIKQPN